MQEMDDAVEELSLAKGGAAARISIGVLPLSRTSLLAAALDELLALHPGIRVDITEGPYDPVLESLRDGRIDFMFGVLRRPDWATDVVEETLLVDHYAIVVRRNHPLTKLPRVTLGDLADYEWIVAGQEAPRRRAFETMFRGLGRPPPTSVETTSLKLVRSLLSISNRVTLLTKLEIEFEEMLGVLATVPFDPGVARRPDGIITRADWRPTPVQVRFLELVRRQAREQTGPGHPRLS